MRTRQTAFLLLLVILFWTSASIGFAQSGIDDFLSPLFLARGANTATIDSPMGDVLNPAAGAGRQNLTLDLNYISLVGLGDESGLGHVVTGGVSIPSSFGVFTTSGQFFSSPFENVYDTTFVGLNFSFAKDLYQNLWFGAGLGFQYGDDWALGLDLGILHFVGDLAFLKDFRWGIAVRDIGKGYFPVEGELAIPPAFTPAIGAGFKLVKTGPFSLSLFPDLSLPTVQDIRVSVGLEAVIYDFLFFDASYVFDLKDFQDDVTRTFPPVSFGLAFKYKPGRGIADVDPEESEVERQQNGIRISSAASPRQDGVWAIGAGINMPIGAVDKNPPEITIDTTRRYVSPNFDGIQDDLVIPLSITDERYVAGYRFIIEDSSGQKVRTIQNKEERPENEGIRAVLDRLIAVKKGITVPESLRWDGRSDTGTVVADGAYSFFVEAWDDNENQGKSRIGEVVVDNTPPAVSLSTPYLIFSPNADGNQDTLIIQQSGSKEDLWKGSMLDVGGQEVVGFHWADSSPAEFEWDGKDTQGVLPPDGVYRYSMTSTDRAGNEASAYIDNIIINTEATPIDVTLVPSEFSPNGDGNKDAVTFSLEIPVKRGISKWEMIVKDQRERVRRTFAGDSQIPLTVTFDGKDDSEEPLPEGQYMATLEVLYEHGNNPIQDSPSFILDVTPPQISLSSDNDVFSPNGDGRKDVITLYQSTSAEKIWTGILTDSSGVKIMTIQWPIKPDETMVWDGRDVDGNLVADGRYAYLLRGEDRAGNVAESQLLLLELDTREPKVQLSTDITYFSPNADGVKDEIWIVPTLSISEGVERFEYRINDVGGETQRVFRGLDYSPGAVKWDGLNEAGQKAGDGGYVAELEIVYKKGDNPQSLSNAFYLDTVSPSIEVSSDFRIFSPDGDGSQDTITFEQSSSAEDLWLGRVIDDRGEQVRGIYWKGRVEDFVWDGKDENGNRLSDGLYTYVVEAEDRAGNSVQKQLRDIRIDTKPTPISIGISTNAFSPNRDGVKDSMAFTLEVPTGTGIKEWELTVVDKDSRAQKRFSGQGSIGNTVAFDGKDDAGRTLPEGVYEGKLAVLYLNGNRPEASSPSFTVDLTPPSASIRTDTDIFSPNGDGSKDAMSFLQETSEERLWAGKVKDRSGGVLRNVSWVGRADERFEWDGRGDNGRILSDGSYIYSLEATDTAGNTGRSRDVSVTIDTRETPVKVLVNLSHFSPNEDGVKDSIRIVPVVDVKDSIESFEYRVRDSAGEVVKTFPGRGSAPTAVVWDGLNEQRGRVGDGAYTAELRVVYRNGNRPVGLSTPFNVDTQFPSITLSAATKLFSPNGDGNKDALRIGQSSSFEDLWKGRIADGRGRTIREFLWKGRTEDLSWDGKDENGNSIDDGSYRYIVSAEDKAGNRTERELDGIQIDTRRTWVYVTVSDRAFSPNEDGTQDSIDFTTYVGLKEGIKEWKLSMVHAERGVQRTFSGTGPVPTKITWDGQSTSGMADTGTYTALLEVVYHKGDRPEGKTMAFRLDTAPPQLDLTLNPLPFSPDNDGIDDELNIYIKVRDDSPIESWKLDILDPKGNPFTSYSGKGEPSAHIIWDGISDRGELVQSAEDYTLTLTMEDELGNRLTERRTIAVDILVIREGNRLKISVSSIIFAPNTADYINIEPAKAEKNRKTLGRLAEILKKYGNYRILIEGHAAMEHFADPERAKREQREELIPLSKARAESVKKGLVGLGVDRNRMTTVGLGGKRPVVAHSDLQNRWKNRRVEFLLLK